MYGHCLKNVAFKGDLEVKDMGGMKTFLELEHLLFKRQVLSIPF